MIGLMLRRTGPLLAALIVAACTAGTTTAPDQSPDPTHSTVDEGRFQVTFSIARTTLRPGDAVDGSATLRLVRNGPGALSGSGSGIFSFSFHEIGGDGRSLDPVFRADCVPYRLGVESPIVSGIMKSGAVSGDEPDAAFKRALLDDPGVRLPSGLWDISAVAGFVDGSNCEGEGHSIMATVRVRVTE